MPSPQNQIKRKEWIKNISISKKGQLPWITGKHHTEKAKEKCRIARAKQIITKGIKKKMSEGIKNAHQRKIFGFQKGKPAWNKGIPRTEETKNKLRKPHRPHTKEEIEKMRIWSINNPNRKFKDTSIELKIESELQRRNINYQKQVPLCKVAIVDFYLPERQLVIECDGDYWHNQLGAKEKDEEKTKALTFNGFNVYRFWGHEINESAKKCIDKLLLK
jgi:very-short-patch-repair endonuclease